MDKARVHAYRRRWLAVDELKRNETPSSGLELRWRQLNAAYGLGKELHLAADHHDEMRVYLRWAKLKEKQPQHLKA
jgi:hypothetical protein